MVNIGKSTTYTPQPIPDKGKRLSDIKNKSNDIFKFGNGCGFIDGYIFFTSRKGSI